MSTHISNANTMFVRNSMAVMLTATALLLPLSVAQADPPDNDDPSKPTIISELPFSDVVDTSEATSEGLDDYCLNGDHTVWYSFTPDTDMLLNVYANTYGDDYYDYYYYYDYPTISVYVDGELITCTNWGELTLYADAGVTYDFMVGSQGGEVGFNLHMIPPPPEVEIKINPTGSFDSVTGSATVSGTVSCSSEAEVEIWGDLKQKATGKLAITGYFYLYAECKGGEMPWSAVVKSSGYFKGGTTTASADVYACNYWYCGHNTTGPMQIKLTGK